MKTACLARVVLCSWSLAMLSCTELGGKERSHNNAPSVPPLRAGAGSGTPIAIELIAPNRVININSQELLAARRLAEAEKQRQELEARLEKEGRSMELALRGNNKELQALDQMILRGSKLEQGVDLELRITNRSPNPIPIHFGPDVCGIALLVEGPGAEFIRYRGPHTADFKTPSATILKPGASRDFPVRELRGGMRNADRWLITVPGRYTAQLQFSTSIPADAKVESGDSEATLPRRLESGARVDLTSKKVPFQVTSGGR